MKYFITPLVVFVVALSVTDSHAARFNERGHSAKAAGVVLASADNQQVRQNRRKKNDLENRKRDNDRTDRRDDRFDNRRDERLERYIKFRIGVRLLSLPARYSRVMIGTSVYYYSDGVYFVGEKGAYVVVVAPIGARVGLLPYGFRSIYLGSRRYFHVNSTYYIYAPATRDYVVVKAPVDAPQGSQTTDMVVYPANGQSDEQIDKDRYECHKWAMNDSGFDPSTQQADSLSESDRYNRAIKACLTGRGYTIN
jgi:hypothetical protein